ncbi:hypothetical protein BCR35DRAFT_298770 [Leucosporidium creatinivorum]|uniref:GP-PDE domain-containing protein n=1 Tax=Leucosporidium creatinivorum TaxID=106004 RepID=A0A1Y2G2G4_9BASI|nr:hypothetical protein BCR35DRAFT_298770 [Leucosporidium creatinivorum]
MTAFARSSFSLTFLDFCSTSTCSRMMAQQATPPTESLPLPIPSNSSSTVSPHSHSHSHSQDDLARRCRQLARSFGHGAVVEQQFGSHGAVRESHSPLRASPNTSPARSPRLTSSLFPLSPTGKIQPPLSPRSSSYPTPEGSFILSEIMEEEGGDDAIKRRIAASSGALSETEASDVEQGAKARQGSRTSSRMTALNSLKLGGENLDEALLRSSLRDGVSHFELDVWLVDGELLVGPDQTTLSAENTLTSMYIDPLLNIFNIQQPPTPSTGSFSHHRRRSSSGASSNHPFPAYLHQPLLLLVDFKTSPEMSLQFLIHFVDPLHDASLLTTYCANSHLFTPGLITIVCAGADAAMRETIHGMSPRFVFAAAPISEDDRMEGKETTPVAIGELGEAVGWSGEGELSEDQKLKVRDQVDHAHAKGMKVFYRGLNKEMGEQVREDLRAEGVDYL